MLSRNFTKLAAFGIVMAIGQIITPNAVCQDASNLSFDDLLNQSKDEYDKFKASAERDYAAFRDSVNREYAAFMRNPWTPTDVHPKLEAPDNKEPGPYIVPEEENDRPTTNSKFFNLESVVMPMWPLPQATPFGEIVEQPTENEKEEFIKFYGTPIFLRETNLSDFRLTGADERAYAKGWETLSSSDNNNFINDCLDAREALALPDWGYLKLLEKIAAKLVGADTNEQTMLIGFLMNQSGYKIRFSYDNQKKLHLLYACDGKVYNTPRYNFDNVRYYSYTVPSADQVYICNFKTPGEQVVDFGIHKSPKFAYSPCETKEMSVRNHSDFTLRLTPNKNLIDFFADYPVATSDMSDYTLWSIHGNTPVSDEVKSQLYPALRKIVEGKQEYEALQILLSLAQTFPYEYDDKVWGRDRAFWMEESWAYPFSDCEDHAVNFSHMVRDILGLDVCLIYYPGHLSSCVALNDTHHSGDYVLFNGRKYLVCDPTYFYANAGMTPRGLNNSEAVLIPLRKVD